MTQVMFITCDRCGDTEPQFNGRGGYNHGVMSFGQRYAMNENFDLCLSCVAKLKEFMTCKV